MTKVISCVNLKGGVGKTAIAVNFAAYCGAAKKKTLLIDLDPQTNATFSCISPEQWDKHKKAYGTVADLLGVRNTDHAEGNSVDPSKIIVRNALPGVDLVPSDLSLFTIDLDIGARTAREKLLKKGLKDTLEQYDVVVCDCPPNLTLPTQNALAISTHYVIPVSPDFLSSLGIALLTNRVKKFADDMEHEIANAGIVLSRVGRASTFRNQTTNDLRKQFKKQMFEAEIKERSVVTESTAKNKSVFQMFDETAKAEFRAFSEELIKRVGL